MDETLDSIGNSIINIVAKPLNDYSRRPYLLMCRVVEKVNSEIMSSLVEQREQRELTIFMAGRLP